MSEAEPVVFLKFTQLRGPAEEGTAAGKTAEAVGS